MYELVAPQDTLTDLITIYGSECTDGADSLPYEILNIISYYPSSSKIPQNSICCSHD